MDFFKTRTDDTLREIASHGSLEFWIFPDEGTVSSIGEEQIILPKGSGIFVNSGVLHRFEVKRTPASPTLFSLLCCCRYGIICLSDYTSGSDLVHYGSQRHSKETIRSSGGKEKKIMAVMRSLRQMPQLFPYFEELYITPNKYHKMFIEKWYLVLYQIQDDTVYVEYILDCRKDYSWLIFALIGFVKFNGITAEQFLWA